MDMPRMVQCTYLKKEAEGLSFAPYPGELGKRIYDNISKEAFEMKTGLTLPMRVPVSTSHGKWKDSFSVMEQISRRVTSRRPVERALGFARHPPVPFILHSYSLSKHSQSQSFG
jgi:hypothetical protein